MEQKDDLAEIFAKFPTYWCVQVVVPKSSVPWFQLSTVCRLRTDWISVSITVNHLGEIDIAIPRQLVDTKKTFGRLYLTVLDFSLLQRVIRPGKPRKAQAPTHPPFHITQAIRWDPQTRNGGWVGACGKRRFRLLRPYSFKLLADLKSVVTSDMPSQLRGKRSR